MVQTKLQSGWDVSGINRIPCIESDVVVNLQGKKTKYS